MRPSARCVAPSTGSCSRTSRPASATTWAMPAPIVPAPSTPTVRISVIGRGTRGSRFSANAATPSAWSSVRPASVLEGRLGRQRLGQGRVFGGIKQPLGQADAGGRPGGQPAGELAAQSSSQRIGRDDGGHKAQLARLVGAQLRSPTRISNARCLPTRSNERACQPGVGHEADAVEGGTKRASSAATTRSAAIARLTPAPAATPFTAATTGFGERANGLDQRVVLGS